MIVVRPSNFRLHYPPSVQCAVETWIAGGERTPERLAKLVRFFGRQHGLSEETLAHNVAQALLLLRA